MINWRRRWSQSSPISQSVYLASFSLNSSSSLLPFSSMPALTVTSSNLSGEAQASTTALISSLCACLKCWMIRCSMCFKDFTASSNASLVLMQNDNKDNCLFPWLHEFLKSLLQEVLGSLKTSCLWRFSGQRNMQLPKQQWIAKYLIKCSKIVSGIRADDTRKTNSTSLRTSKSKRVFNFNSDPNCTTNLPYSLHPQCPPEYWSSLGRLIIIIIIIIINC